MGNAWKLQADYIGGIDFIQHNGSECGLIEGYASDYTFISHYIISPSRAKKKKMKEFARWLRRKDTCRFKLYCKQIHYAFL